MDSVNDEGTTTANEDDDGATGGVSAAANDVQEEGATAAVNGDDSDDEVTFWLPYQEVAGKKKDSKGTCKGTNKHVKNSVFNPLYFF